MKSRWLCCLLLGFAACAMPRPDNSWEPEEDAEADDGGTVDGRDGGARRPDRDEREVPKPDTSTPVAADDAGVEKGPDAEPAISPGHPLAALDGKRFLMRMDMYSSVDTTVSIVRLRLKNRISNLFLVDFSLVDGRMVGHEVLCDQTYDHKCESGCEPWETYVDPAVIDKYFTNDLKSTRTYEFDEETGELTGGVASLALGFNEAEGTDDVPTDTDDERLWSIAGGGLGLYTHFDARVGNSIKTSVNCEVSVVQRFVTTFSGKLAGESPSLEGVEFELQNVDGTDAKTVDVSGVPQNQCTQESLDGQTGNDLGAAVRFMEHDEGCPANFDEVFAPKPLFR